jgi:hypothetical protein
VTAFKRDLLTTDLICVAIEFTDEAGTQHIELHEELEGFGQLLLLLEKNSGFVSDWREKVTLPPFEANVTVLWERRRTSDQLTLG